MAMQGNAARYSAKRGSQARFMPCRIKPRILKCKVFFESRLRATADRLGLSLDQTDIRVLEAATGGRPDAPKRDLSEIAARWSDREAEVFDRVTAPFESVDAEVWR